MKKSLLNLLFATFLFSVGNVSVLAQEQESDSYVKVSNYALACDGTYDEDGDIKIVVTYDAEVPVEYAEDDMQLIFTYEVRDVVADTIVASGQKDPQNVDDGTFNIYVNALRSDTKYSVGITSVVVYDYDRFDWDNVDWDNFDWDNTIIAEVLFSEEAGVGSYLTSITFTTGTPTGIANVEAAPAAKADGKYLENGQIVIYRGGVKYNAAGAVIR